jgi:uncharacterized protein (DUF1684 family)
MHSLRGNRWIHWVASLVLGMCYAHVAAAIDYDSEKREVERWRAERLERLQSPTGWLTLIGLYWLKDGENSFGKDATNALALDYPGIPAQLGTFVVEAGKVRFVADPTSGVLTDGAPATDVVLTSDAAGKPTVLNLGSVQFFLIERAGKLGVRVRDTNHPLRRSFEGLQYYRVDTQFAIQAKFEPYEPARKIRIVNVLGLEEEMISPGAAVFRKDGKEWRLDTLLETPDADELFILFADATSGRETYGAGRFLYAPLPKDGRVFLDFNKAYNPPCAFSNFSTCPLPPKQNRLKLTVVAGEKKYGSEPASAKPRP